ncbi:PTS sugar transporter subunit IIA, partial [Lentibacillus sp.]|uniref:PTS sugar transporter subunit IIA n=1 Tax=Lentibacillus sp. TaxID=1925746 RepID=UPI002B4AAE09
KQVENKSLFDLEDIEKGDYDVIVSTIPLSESEHEYILTSPMLTKTEVERVKRAVRKRKTSVFKKQAKETSTELDDKPSDFKQQLQVTQAYSTAVLDVLKSLDVLRLSGKKSLENVLQLMCDKLAENGIIRNASAVKQTLLERQAKSGLGIPGTHFALYHTRSHDVEEPSFTIYPLGQPLKVRGMDGNEMAISTLLLMLAPQDTGKEVLETLSFLSSLIIEDESVRLLESGDRDRIEQYLSKQFYKWLHEKI